MQFGQKTESLGAVAGSSLGATMTAGAANTKGAYLPIGSATTYPGQALEIIVLNGSLAGRYAVDIAIGGVGSEKIIFADLHFACGNTICSVYHVVLPVALQAGVQLNARMACSGGAATAQILLIVCAGDDKLGACGAWTTYGFESADTSGIQVDPGGTANTKGAYSTITASTTAPIHSMLVDVTHQGNTAPQVCSWLIDIAYGDGPTIIVADAIDFATSNARLPGIVTLGPYPVNIPSGVALAAAAQCSINDATDRLIDIVIHGGARTWP